MCAPFGTIASLLPEADECLPQVSQRSKNPFQFLYRVRGRTTRLIVLFWCKWSPHVYYCWSYNHNWSLNCLQNSSQISIVVVCFLLEVHVIRGRVPLNTCAKHHGIDVPVKSAIWWLRAPTWGYHHITTDYRYLTIQDRL